ncbi:fimbrial biogenesis outer membrane usher protein [Pseudomonas yamanorum]|uniref:fimbria/pilus outer membrane usher protein n=1 Tax=Pseudomonas yamanorum TaxID=515393 RepID=UPI0015A3787B|nr:fimbria/pilus outer membrane usher protein [Pseudomonas yamanorum]NVZ84483.1 fimbrial biogenesis outer membrane usher protein [Pseudomonas yamanorum]
MRIQTQTRSLSAPAVLSGICGLLFCPKVLASAAMFDLDAFSGGTTPGVDVSRFNRRNNLGPGQYRVDLAINGQSAGRHELDFIAEPQQEGAVPCLDWPLLERLGVVRGKVEPLPVPGPLCGDLGSRIPMAVSTFDSAALTLAISVPQVYMNAAARGAVDPARWDEGITAGLLSYNFSSSTTTRGTGEDHAYLGLNSGLNLGHWRLRHQGAQSWDSRHGRATYQNTSTYLQRNLAAWQSRLTLGDSFSSGQVLDSTRLRGISLSSDDQMVAPSQQGYAPVVRGIADTQATVRVSQNGYTIYETSVAPGPFVIDDLFPTGSGGDLTVTVSEVDGRKTVYTVPFSVAPHLLRSEVTRYSLALGEVRHSGIEGGAPLAFQGTLQHGLLDRLTVYGGASLSQGYIQGNAGVAFGTGWGAFSVDLTDSRAHIPGHGVLTGQNLGVSYNKNLTQTGTHFTVGAYRFSTVGYLNLTDAMNVRELGRQQGDIDAYARQKSRLDLSVSQQVGLGALGFSVSSTDYWNRRQGRETSLSVSYGAAWRQVSWNLSAQRSRVEEYRQHTGLRDARIPGGGQVDNRLLLTLSMPLGSGVRAPSLSTTLSASRGESSSRQQQLGISGVLDDAGAINYGVSASNAADAGGAQRSASANVGYHASTANVRMGYGQAGGNSQWSFNADGGLIVHDGGLTFSHYLGEAAALVHVPDAQGALLNSGNVRVDRRGYAVVPSLRAYQANTVGIDPDGTAQDVELTQTTQDVVPTLGAVTRVIFKTVVGRAVVVKARRERGEPLPFAAQVFDEQGNEVGVIGQASKAFVRGIADQGSLTVKWGEKSTDQCAILYRLPPAGSGRQSQVDQVQGECRVTQS